MPILAKYQADFCEGNIYHVFNRTNNKELLFITDDNRRFFLKQYDHYLGLYADTFCWCLLSNHFHLLIRIKSTEAITKALETKKKDGLTATENNYLKKKIDLSELIEIAFKNFFQSYSLAFNKQHNRKGNLFYKPFKRLVVNNDVQLTQAIVYIHANPLKHNIAESFDEFKWSSYRSFLSHSPTRLLRDEVLDWFGNQELFKSTHSKLAKHYYEDVSIEE